MYDKINIIFVLLIERNIINLNLKFKIKIFFIIGV